MREVDHQCPGPPHRSHSGECVSARFGATRTEFNFGDERRAALPRSRSLFFISLLMSHTECPQTLTRAHTLRPESTRKKRPVNEAHAAPYVRATADTHTKPTDKQYLVPRRCRYQYSDRISKFDLKSL